MSDDMRQRLQRSNYIFSGIKTFHELGEAFPSLIDENGNRKPFEQFLNDVQRIDRTYSQNYLRAEYNFCQTSADMAAKWERFSEDGDRYNLQYRTQRDNKVRPQHATLDYLLKGEKIFGSIPDDCYANPDLWVDGIGFVDVKSPKKTTNCCRNANHASKELYACVCLTNHSFKSKVITEKQLEDRNRAIWISDDYHHEYIFWLIDGTIRKYKRP